MATMQVSDVFRFCPSCGGKGFKTREVNLLICGQCHFHYHINPVAAAAVIVEDRTGRILLIRRAKEPSKGKLGIPGGFVDLNETAEQALRREALEEVNLELPEIRFLTSAVNYYLYRDVSYPVLDLFFAAKVESFEGVEPRSEVESLVFAKLHEFDFNELAFPSIRKAFERFKQGRS